MNTSQSNKIVVNLSEYTTPVIREVKNGDYVQYGEDNDYFNYLIDRSERSTTNNAIITGISNLIYGKGLGATNAGKFTSEFTEILTKVRPKDLKKVIYDRKALGMAAFQIIYKDAQPSRMEHFPMHTLRAEKKNDKGEIQAYYYHPDFGNMQPKDKPERIAAYGFGNRKDPEIYIWQSYQSGNEYYTAPDYAGSIPYAVLEEEIADYLINDTLNGFAPTSIVNYNNGVPDNEDERLELKHDTERKLTGARGKKVIVAFNEDEQSRATIDSIPLNDAPAHYEYLSKECFNKLIVGHRVTSPMLLGIRDGQSGLGNNADEIKNATLLFENIVIRVFQNQLIDIIKDIFPSGLDLYFKTIQPLEFMQVDDELSQEEEEKQTGVELAALQDSFEQNMANKLIEKGEDETDDFLLLDEEDADVDIEDYINDFVAEQNNKLKRNETVLDKALYMARTVTARPNAKDPRDEEKDGFIFKVRYQYAPRTTSSNSREFCRRMVAADKLYRKRDIDMTNSEVVNKGFGPRGKEKYSIWKYKGSVNCKHRWVRKVYMKKIDRRGASIDVKSPLAQRFVKSLRAAIASGYSKGVAEDYKTAKTRPIDMPRGGRLN